MSKNVSEKKFVYFIIGLFITNIFANIIIPIFTIHRGIDINALWSLSFSYIFLTYLWIHLGMFYVFPFQDVPLLTPLGFLTYVFVSISIISIPIVIKLSKGIRLYRRIIYVYLIHMGILPLFSWLWFSTSGFDAVIGS